jgi:hypothetical protein
MVWGGLFQFGTGGKGLRMSSKVLGENGDAIAMGVYAPGMDGKGLLGGEQSLMVALEAFKEKETFPSAGSMLPWGLRNGFTVEPQAFLVF